MKPVRLAAALALAAAGLTACGAQEPRVKTGPEAPTGLAPGITLYFVKGDRIVPQTRETGRLGTVSDAVSLLLTGPGGSGLTSGIGPTTMTRTEVTVSSGVVTLRLPLATSEVEPLGVDQLVCTAVAAHVQAGGSATTRVRLLFTDVGEEDGPTRSCSR